MFHSLKEKSYLILKIIAAFPLTDPWQIKYRNALDIFLVKKDADILGFRLYFKLYQAILTFISSHLNKNLGF